MMCLESIVSDPLKKKCILHRKPDPNYGIPYRSYKIKF